MEEFYTVREVAERLKVKVETVQGWIRKGELIAYKVGKDYRIAKDDYLTFLRQRRTK